MTQKPKQIRQSLKEHADAQTLAGSKRFFKENDSPKLKFLGVKSALVKKVAREQFAAIKDTSKEDVFALCDQLWQSGYLEETVLACDWAYRFRREFETKDFEMIERWVDQYVNNWASCDTLCNHTIGTLLEMFPKLVGKLKRWAKSENLWLRRAAAVSLIIPARKGLFHKEIFEIAKILLHDPEDLVQKGYGWMLKAAADSDQDAVFQFVMSHKTTMPRTALRYAIEKMPNNMRKMAMGKDDLPSPSTKTSVKTCKPKAGKKKAAIVPHLLQRYDWVDD